MSKFFQVFVLLFVVAVIRPALSEPTDAFLVVSKSADLNRIAEDNEEISVSFKIFNTGGSTAYDVALTDDGWPSSSFEVSGNTSVTWEKLESGGTLEHAFLVKPTEKGSFQSPRATVTYRATTKTELQTSFSTPVGELDLLSGKPLESKFKWVQDLAIQFGPLVSAISIVAIFFLVVLSPPSKSSKKRR